jgi:hypothetical protein
MGRGQWAYTIKGRRKIQAYSRLRPAYLEEITVLQKVMIMKSES